MDIISERLKILIKETGMEQQHVGVAMGLVPSTFAGYANGNRRPNIGTLKIIADYFNVTVDYLVGYSEKRNPYVINLDHLSEEQKQFIADSENIVYLDLAMDIKSKTNKNTESKKITEKKGI